MNRGDISKGDTDAAGHSSGDRKLADDHNMPPCLWLVFPSLCGPPPLSLMDAGSSRSVLRRSASMAFDVLSDVQAEPTNLNETTKEDSDSATLHLSAAYVGALFKHELLPDVDRLYQSTISNDIVTKITEQIPKELAQRNAFAETIKGQVFTSFAELSLPAMHLVAPEVLERLAFTEILKRQIAQSSKPTNSTDHRVPVSLRP